MLRKALLSLLAAALLLFVPPAPASRSFDVGRNGIWIRHQWYTGVYLHAGPLLPRR